MKNFTYTRTKTNDKWNINNLNDVDIDGNSVTLYKRIYEIFPLNKFKVYLNETEAKVNFEQDLDSNEISNLNAAVLAHENANGTINKNTYLRLVSANGTIYKIYVDNTGTLYTEVL